MIARRLTRPLAVLAIAWTLSACCARERWDCQACLVESPERCARSPNTENGSASQARCDAAEALCASLDKPTFQRLCLHEQVSRMTGCSETFMAKVKTTCTERTKWDVPLVGVK